MESENLFVVGIGSSAGGVPALVDLLHVAVCHRSMCFVIVAHLARDRKSDLTRITSRAANLEAVEIQDGMRVEHCKLYVIPPGHYVRMQGRRLFLEPRPEMPVNNAVDYFLKSLASEHGKNSIGVILSGAEVGRDGAEGIRAIKAAGGHTYAQSPETALFPDMPKAAIATGCIDSILSPEAIGHELSLINWALKDEGEKNGKHTL